eukprot:CAMPEP_0178472190 /NCGR_PEP_ID=MMETSP0696-20121128/1441_1 /TAXON_ID=265572 /ORGANISM="Extubocellulus spinifer, Strain CCMP396" /LENGTH=724 /DNA_ID=CAMNT_0020099369 /DNA_START=190 /DNA_END=2364 /DNA_ORIENTATION=-
MKGLIRGLALAGILSTYVAGFPSKIRRRAQDMLPDASSSFQSSTESEFDHMFVLSGSDSAPTAPKLTFHWNDPVRNTFKGRLIHRAPKAESDSGWLGFAAYDTPFKGVPTADMDLMVGSQAIIGQVATNSVSKYVLAGKREGPGGVERMEESFQSLIPTGTSIHQFTGDDGHVTTILTFEKLLMENDSAEIMIETKGKNTFLYAAGPPAEAGGGLGFHVLRGGFTLDFQEIMDQVAVKTGGTTTATTSTANEPVPAPAPETTATTTGEAPKEASVAQEPATTTTTSENGASTVDASSTTTTTTPAVGAPPSDVPSACTPEDPSYLHTETLTNGLKMHYKLNNLFSDTAASSVSVKLEYSGLAWLGFGFSTDGKMIDSEAVIGRPDLAAADEEKPLKYNLKGKGTTAVIPMEEARQTLTDALITQDGTNTVMTFTKILEEEGEHTIDPAVPIHFIYAIGDGNTLAYHAKKGTIQLNLSTCLTGAGAKTAGGTGQNSNRTMWAAHGILATLALALATPLAVTTAWFRTLVPSSWIYIHVFANVSSFFMILLSFILAVMAMSMSKNPAHFSDPHHIAGLAILMLVTFQVMNGFLRPPVEKRDPYAMESKIAGIITIPGTARELWKILHHCAGLVVLGVGFWQLKTGMDLYAADFTVGSWKPYFYAYLAIFGTVIVLLKLWMIWEERKARMGLDSMNPDQRRMGSAAIANGVDPDSELVPVQFDVGMQ